MNDQKYALDIIAGGYERTIRRLIAVIIVLSVAIVLIVSGFLWYLNQYDFSATTTEYAQDGQGVNIIGSGNGVDYNGPETQSDHQTPDP